MSYQKSNYRHGKWRVQCDRCGHDFHSDQLYKTWDGLMVCKINDCWEPRQPQDFLRAVRDDQSVPWTRSEPADVETKICDGRGAIAGMAQAGCAIAGSTQKTITVPAGTFDMSF